MYTANQTDTLQAIEYSVRTVLCSWLLVTYWLAETGNNTSSPKLAVELMAHIPSLLLNLVTK